MMVIWIVVFTSMMTHGHLGWSMLVTTFAAMFTFMSLFFGPQMVRLDFRQDLPMADVLKTLPMRGWQVVLGEVLAPAVLLACFQWLLIVVFLFASPEKIGNEHLAFGMKLSACLAAAVVLPFLDLIAILLQNTGVLLLPAWFQFDKTAPRGIETMGQQLILVFGQILALAIALIPAVAVSAGIIAVGHFVMPLGLAIIVAAIAAAIVMCVEVAIAIRLLGGVFERFDLSAELTER